MNGGLSPKKGKGRHETSKDTAIVMYDRVLDFPCSLTTGGRAGFGSGPMRIGEQRAAALRRRDECRRGHAAANESNQLSAGYSEARETGAIWNGARLL